VWDAGFHYPAGGKTGTTNDGTNVWFIGYTSDLVAGVWMGFDRPQTIQSNAQGGTLAAPAWTTFMREVYMHRAPPSDWTRPDDIVTRIIDSRSGLLYAPACADGLIVTEFYVPGTEPVNECGTAPAYIVGASQPQMPPGTPGTPGAPGGPNTPGTPPIATPPAGRQRNIEPTQVRPGAVQGQTAFPLRQPSPQLPSRTGANTSVSRPQ
jgi:penicillin-binding protein 1A